MPVGGINETPVVARRLYLPAEIHAGANQVGLAGVRLVLDRQEALDEIDAGTVIQVYSKLPCKASWIRDCTIPIRIS